MKHLPWAAPTVAILAVGTGFLGNINLSFGNDAEQAAVVAPESQPQVVAPEVEAAVAAVAAVQAPEPEPVVVPEVSQQLANLLEETAEEAQVEVTRSTGFSIDVLEEARDAALSAQPAAEPQPTTQPVGADFFAAAQANLDRDRRCIDDLKTLASQARVYFPSGGLTGEQAGIGQARVLGVLAAQCPGVVIQVSGHSDPSGNPVTNQRLSLERAEAVITRVAASGVDASLFQAMGMGDTVPSTVSGPQPASYYDRRVEFSVIETATQANFVAPSFGAPGAQFQTAACVAQLQTAVQGASIQYDPRGMTIGAADLARASQLAGIAANCPQARLRIVGQHSSDPRLGEDSSTGRLRAVVLMTKLVAEGFPSEQLILGAPSEAQPVAGLSDSRIDFDVILEDL